MEIVDLDAEDRDEGINSELVYFFVGGSQDLGPFHIDRNNGTLHLWGELDYESTTDYTVCCTYGWQHSIHYCNVYTEWNLIP